MKIGTIDCETDPFEYGAQIKPFCVGIYTGEDYRDFWGDDCVERAVVYLETLPEPICFYAHNGGNFDYYFFLPYIENDLLLINGRIAKAWLGKHQLRDSYSLFPQPLSAYKKDDLSEDDYLHKFKKDQRENHKEFILKYLKNDCVYLFEVMSSFRERFGDNLTIGGTAMKQLRKFHEFERADEKFHTFFKPFYFGGRNQCFESGVIRTKGNIYDVNSQYPSVMRDFLHPVGTGHSISQRITKNTFFAEIDAVNFGALPIRTKTGLDFTQNAGTFTASIHEINAGLDTGTLKINKVIAAYNFHRTTTFAEFIDHFYDLRLKAKHSGDHLGNLFYKTLVNSSYGKFAQSPEHYEDYIITHNIGRPFAWPDEDQFELRKSNGEYFIWGRPTKRKTYYNIATGASITGAARSVLLRGLAQCDRPLYCDTDSIMCESFKGEIDPDTLGAWKHEGEFDEIAIGGKKLYAAFLQGACIKKAHKGARLSGDQIRAVALGETVNYQSQAPRFNMQGTDGNFTQKYLPVRNIRRTAV